MVNDMFDGTFNITGLTGCKVANSADVFQKLEESWGILLHEPPSKNCAYASDILKVPGTTTWAQTQYSIKMAFATN